MLGILLMTTMVENNLTQLAHQINYGPQSQFQPVKITMGFNAKDKATNSGSG